MASFTWIVNSASDWMVSLGESSLRAAVLLSAAGAACWLLRKRSAALRHLIWALSLAAIVIMPFSLDVAPKVSLPAFWQPSAPPAFASFANVPSPRPELAPEPMVVVPSGIAAKDAPDPGAGALELSASATRTAQPASSARPYGPILPALLLAGWAAGCFVFLARLVVGHTRVRRMSAGATRLDPAADLAGSFESRRRVRFLQSTSEAMPMTWGWRKPAVLLPASFGLWDRGRQSMTIYHELAHVQRADWLTQTLAQLVRAVYWFHPLVWLALNRMRIEADRACDDMVLRAGVKPSGYAGHLVQAAREFRTAGLRPWVAIAMAHPSSLNHRVHYVLDATIVRSGLGRRRALALALGVALAVLAVPSIEAVGQTATAPDAPQQPQAPSIAAEAPGTVPDFSQAAVQDTERAAREPRVTEAPELLWLAQAQPQPQPEPGVVDPARRALEQAAWQAAQAQESADEANLYVGTHFEVAGKPRLSPQATQTAAAALRKALGSSDANVRAEAAESLGLLGSSEEANLQALASALSDSEPRVQQNAVQSLGLLLQRNKQISGEDAVRWLDPALSSPNPNLRREAAEALGRLRGAAAIDAATKLVGDSDAQVQREAIESLGHLLYSSDAQSARSALPVLQKTMQHDDPNVRRQLVETLGGLHQIADEVVPLLAQATEDSDPAVQREAVEALGRISSPGVHFSPGWDAHFGDGDFVKFPGELAKPELEIRLKQAQDAITAIAP